jgi:hypothetical protein
MFIHWNGYGLYWYFKLEGFVICIRFIPFINKFDEDKRHFAWWRIK